MVWAKVNFTTSIIMIKLKGLFMFIFVVLGSLNKDSSLPQN